MTRRTLTSAATATALLLALSACSGEDEPAVEEPTTSSATATDDAAQPTDATDGSAVDTTDGPTEEATEGTDGSSATQQAPSDDTTQSGPPSPSEPGVGQGADAATTRAAIETAEAEGGGTAYDVDLDDRDSVFEIDVLEGETIVEYRIGADGSTVQDSRTDDSDDDDVREARAELDGAEVSLADAVETALADTPGTLDSASLDEDDNALIFDVSIDTETDDDLEVHVDAVTGEVVHSERD